ncbi:hypothetical protein [Rhodopseudomonas sp. AAP120]|nr:hypothetical protein [Rhodopseudomonas sp. AAP120]
MKTFGAHIFVDDQEKHVLRAANAVVAGHVPEPHSLLSVKSSVALI